MIPTSPTKATGSPRERQRNRRPPARVRTAVRRRVVVVSLVVLASLGALAGLAFLPVTANHFGYALPGRKGLPFRVHYQDRDYRSHLTCARASWCEAEMTPADRARPYCTPGTELRASLALVRVDEIGTLFGPPHGLFVDAGYAPDQTPMAVLVEASEDCYVSYTLMGGP